MNSTTPPTTRHATASRTTTTVDAPAKIAAKTIVPVTRISTKDRLLEVICSEVALEPVDDSLEAVDAPVGATELEQQVRLLRVAHHLDRPAELAQHRECDVRLPGRASEVSLGLEEEERRRVAVQLGARRAVEHAREVVPRLLHTADVLSDREPVVGLAVEGEEIEHRVLAHRGCEASGVVPEKPVGHVP